MALSKKPVPPTNYFTYSTMPPSDLIVGRSLPWPSWTYRRLSIVSGMVGLLSNFVSFASQNTLSISLLTFYLTALFKSKLVTRYRKFVPYPLVCLKALSLGQSSLIYILLILPNLPFPMWGYFADDTAITICRKTKTFVQRKLPQLDNQIALYFQCWQLRVNPSKTKIIY